jgi:Mce-associated membrane protein
VVLVLLLGVSGGLAAWLYFSQYRPDEQTDAAAGRAAVDAARDGTVALLSYKPDTLNQDFAAAKSHLTGDFLNYYDQFTQQVVTPAAKEKALTTTAQVVGAAVSELHSNSAVVLVYVNQATTSKDRPDPAMASSSVKVSLTKVHGKWLITKFDPV